MVRYYNLYKCEKGVLQMKLLFGTGNAAKLAAMRRRLEPLDVEIIGLCDLNMNIPDVVEDGKTPLENAEKKASAEMIEHYSSLARKYGDLTARYKNAICLITDSEHIYSAMDDSMASEPFIITAKPHSSVVKKGFPLDSLSVDIKTGKYYYDLDADELDRVAVEDGFLDFFRKYL